MFTLSISLLFVNKNLLDEADITSVGYVCPLEVSDNVAKLPHLFNWCYHMVDKSSEVSKSIFDKIRVENVCATNSSYSIGNNIIIIIIATIKGSAPVLNSLMEYLLIA